MRLECGGGVGRAREPYAGERGARGVGRAGGDPTRACLWQLRDECARRKEGVKRRECVRVCYDDGVYLRRSQSGVESKRGQEEERRSVCVFVCALI